MSEKIENSTADLLNSMRNHVRTLAEEGAIDPQRIKYSIADRQSIVASRPNDSDRKLGLDLCVDHKTIAADRRALRGENSPGGGENSPPSYSLINVESPAVKALSEAEKRELEAACDELCSVAGFLEWAKEHLETNYAGIDKLDAWGGLFEIGKRHVRAGATFCRLFPDERAMAEVQAFVEKAHAGVRAKFIAMGGAP
jgi:hypothetical protein